jgi:hypothetical protein
MRNDTLHQDHANVQKTKYERPSAGSDSSLSVCYISKRMSASTNMTEADRMIRLATIIVLAHLVIYIIHGMAHSALHIGLPLWGTIFVIAVIGVGPIAGLLLLWSRRVKSGAVTLALTTAGSLLFGLWYHFVVSGVDHVAHLPDDPWKLPFQVTAVLLLLTEAVGAAVGTALLRR